MKMLLTILMAAVYATAAAQGPQGPRRQAEMTDPSVHDPVVAFCEGRYYLFCTGFGVTQMSSSDLRTWKFEKQVLSPVPEWARQAVPGYNGHTWAPDIIFRDGTYYLYYSCSTFGKNTSAIGVATNRTLNTESPDYQWVDHGMVLQSLPYRDMWNAIDPNVIVDGDGTPWMVFGSFWDGIKLTRLDKSMLRLSEPQQWFSLCRRERAVTDDSDPGTGAVEAPFIFYKDGWYWLFVSTDYCCRGKDSTYKVQVGRSSTVTGPYLDRDGRSMLDGGGTVVVAGNGRYPGVGHTATVTFNGRDYLFFHDYDETRNGQSVLLIREIDWSTGWPQVTL